MVSQSNTNLIFITLGTTRFPFTRLLKSVDNVLNNVKYKPKIVLQAPNHNYRFRYKNIKQYSSLPIKKLIKLTKKADKVIMHAGYGSVFLLTEHCKAPPLIIARKRKFKEHVNDHQYEFLNFLKKEKQKEVGNLLLTEDNIEKQLRIFLLRKAENKNFKKPPFFSLNKDKLLIEISKDIGLLI